MGSKIHTPTEDCQYYGYEIISVTYQLWMSWYETYGVVWFSKRDMWSADSEPRVINQQMQGINAVDAKLSLQAVFTDRRSALNYARKKSPKIQYEAELKNCLGL